MIAPEAGLSVSRQCALLGIARSSFYYRPQPESAEELDLLKRLDRIFTSHPVYGSRRLQVALLREGISIGRRRVRRLMRKLGLWAVRPKRNTSKRHPEHQVYPYLLRGKTIDQPNQVWAADVTYIPMQQGFLYLVAIIDWATRRVLSWRLSNTLTAGFASARSKASSDVSGGGKNEAPGTCAQPAHAAHAIQNFQYYAGPTGHITFWNEGPVIPTNQPEARESHKADGLPAIKRPSSFSCREIPSPPEQPTAAATPPPVSALWFSSAQSTE
jgi:putative transposase